MNEEKVKNKIDCWKKGDYVLAYSFNYDRAGKTNDEILKYIEKQDKEIERLNKDNGDITILFAKEREETKRLNNIINRTTKYVESLSSKGRDCEIYWDIKQNILKELKENK